VPHINPRQRPRIYVGPKELIASTSFELSRYTATVKLSSVRVTAW
jgi:hypothetical protein